MRIRIRADGKWHTLRVPRELYDQMLRHLTLKHYEPAACPLCIEARQRRDADNCSAESCHYCRLDQLGRCWQFLPYGNPSAKHWLRNLRRRIERGVVQE